METKEDMASLLDKIRNTERVLAFAGALTAASLNGCKTITRTEIEYGKSIPRSQIVEEKEEIRYYISDLKRDSNSLDLTVNKHGAKIQTIKTYDEIPATEVRYRVKRRANSGGVIMGTILYSLANVIMVGVPLLIDGIKVIMLQPEKTMLNKAMLGEEFLWGPNREEIFSYIDEKREILRGRLKSEEKNLKFQENNSIDDVPAKQIDVELNDSLVKRTDDNGYVVFEIPESYEGKIIVETLAKDGQNDRVEF